MWNGNCVVHFSMYHKTQWLGISKNLQHFGTKCRITSTNHVLSCAPRFALSLETKWGIKHDVAKFVGHYTIVLAFCESRTRTKDVLWKALNLYKTKHPKQSNIHLCSCLVCFERHTSMGWPARRNERKG